MTVKKSTTQELEEVLQEIGQKIEELVKKGAEAGGEIKEEIEQKIRDLKENKTTLEAELKKAKDNEKIDTLRFARQIFKIGDIGYKGHDLRSHKSQVS